MRLYRHRERACPAIQGGVSIACARCGIQLGKEQFGLPAQEEWMPTHFIRRGNRNGGKVTDFRKAEIWLLGYLVTRVSWEASHRRSGERFAHKGSYPQPVEKIGYFIPFGEGSLKNSFPYFLCWFCFLRKGNQVTKFSPAGKRLPDEEKELPAHWRRNRVSFRRLSKFLQDKPANTRYNGDTAREVICYEENPHRRHRHR